MARAKVLTPKHEATSPAYRFVSMLSAREVLALVTIQPQRTRMNESLPLVAISIGDAPDVRTMPYAIYLGFHLRCYEPVLRQDDRSD